MEKIKHSKKHCISILRDIAKDIKNYDIVVNEKETMFIIFKEYSLENLVTKLAYFKGLIFFEGDNVVLKIRMKASSILLFTLMYLVVIFVSIYLLIKGDFSFLFFGIVLLIGLLSIFCNKKKYRRFIVNLLNDFK
jgi:hypothetical protein